jgi:hypothetical protein
LKFYNFVCSIEKGPKAKKRPLDDIEADREIVSFYVRYHYLLSQNDTTGSNALIGAWQKKLGHQNLWEDFNLEYERGPPPNSGKEHTHSRSARVTTRKSTGGISAPKPAKKIDILSRRRSTECHYFSDSSLTPLPSSDDEDDTPLRITTMQLQKSPSLSSRNAVSRPTKDPPSRDSRDHLVGVKDQGISYNYTSQDENMDPWVAEVVHESADDPMNGASVSAACLPSGRWASQPVTEHNDAKSLSAPVPRSSSAPRQKRRNRTNWSLRKKPSKRKKADHVEETTDQPMAIDPPAAVDPEPEPEPPTIEPVHQDIAPSEPFIPRLEQSEIPSLKISIRPPVSIPPIVQEIRVPFSTSCANIPLPRPGPASNPDPSPDGLKGLSDTPVATIPGFPRPTLPGNPPIWAQVRIVRNSS